jgi:hypothetical protein
MIIKASSKTKTTSFKGSRNWYTTEESHLAIKIGFQTLSKDLQACLRKASLGKECINPRKI